MKGLRGVGLIINKLFKIKSDKNESFIVSWHEFAVPLLTLKAKKEKRLKEYKTY